MAATSTRLLILRHGETDWSESRRHTGRTDVPLNDAGRTRASKLNGHLQLDDVVATWSSPLVRASETAELAGLHVDRTDDDLMEWDYGAAEGTCTPDIREDGHPGWDIWDDGVQMLGGGGETADDVGARADRVIARSKELEGTVVLVAHSHLLRILTARWLEFPAIAGRHFTLDPAGWAELGWERDTPVIERWNAPEDMTR